MILGFDTETTGLPPRGASVTDPRYPRLVQLGLVLVDPVTERELAAVEMLVRPEGYKEMAEDAFKAHGISYDTALRAGVPVKVALAAYTNLRRAADLSVGHNVEYDEGILKSELYRAGVDLKLAEGPVACTADLGAPVANLPPTERMVAAGYNKPKRPKLIELHTVLFGRGFEGAHSALVDARAAVRCYLELKKRGAA